MSLDYYVSHAQVCFNSYILFQLLMRDSYQHLLQTLPCLEMTLTIKILGVTLSLNTHNKLARSFLSHSHILKMLSTTYPTQRLWRWAMSNCTISWLLWNHSDQKIWSQVRWTSSCSPWSLRHHPSWHPRVAASRPRLWDHASGWHSHGQIQCAKYDVNITDRTELYNADSSFAIRYYNNCTYGKQSQLRLRASDSISKHEIPGDCSSFPPFPGIISSNSVDYKIDK